MVSNGHTAPVRIVSPGGQIAEDLRLATALFTPEEGTRVVALPAFVGDAADVHWAPVMVAELVEALQVHFVVDCVSVLKFGKRLAEVSLIEL